MHATLAALAALLTLQGPVRAGPRVLVWLPRDGANLEGEVRRTFAWSGSLIAMGAGTVALRFEPSPQGLDQLQREQRLDGLIRSAESSFGALRLQEAVRKLDGAAALLEGLPPSARREQAYVRLHLLRSRIELARRDARASSAAVARAAEAAMEVELDEADYPPQIRQAFLAARARLRAQPARALRVQSAPPDAEIEVNGRLAGRTPGLAELPPGRCFLRVARAGFKAYLDACPSGPSVDVALEEATREGLRDLLRERLGADPAWFLEPLLLKTLAREEEVGFIVVLDRDRSGALNALVYSASERALKPLEPSRYAEAELDKLSAAVRELVSAAGRLDAQAVETATGVPALEVRSADLELRGAAAFVRRAGQTRYERLALSPQGPGRFGASLPLSLAVEGRWDLEFYAEGSDRDGAMVNRAGDAAAPLRYRREPFGASVAVAPPAWYTRWYVWTAVGVVATGAAATTYFALRPSDVSVRFGARK